MVSTDKAVRPTNVMDKKIMIVQNTSEISTASLNKVLTELALEKDNTNPEKIKQLIQKIVTDYQINQ